jgi:hypothetical protein
MSERGELKKMGAKAQKNSGRGQFQKGDGILGSFVVDVKEYSKSYSISQDTWAKICTDALKHEKDKNPVIQLVLGNGSVVRLAVVEWSLFEQMRELLDGE